MYTRFYKKIEGLSTLPNLFIALLVQSLLQVVLALVISPEIRGFSPENILDLRYFYTGDDAFNYISALGAGGRQWYKYHILVDLLYPVAYTAAFLFLIIFLSKRAGFKEQAIRIMIIIPLILLCSDYLENLGNLALILAFPNRIFIYDIAGYFTLLKQSLLLINLILTAIIGLAALKRLIIKGG